MATKAKAKKPASKATSIKAKMKKSVPARKAAPKPAKAAPRAKADDSFTSYSGKFTVRLPRSLHQQLVDRAEKEGVSLNLFVTNALSAATSGSRRK